MGGVLRSSRPTTLIGRAQPSSTIHYHRHTENASHYSVAVIPAVVKSPVIKLRSSKACSLSSATFSLDFANTASLADEANSAIATLLVDLNNKLQEAAGSRRSTFDEFERSSLKALPSQRYQYADWKVARVGLIHVDIDVHYYSVPHASRVNRSTFDIRTGQSRSSTEARVSPPARSTRRVT